MLLERCVVEVRRIGGEIMRAVIPRTSRTPVVFDVTLMEVIGKGRAQGANAVARQTVEIPLETSRPSSRAGHDARTILVKVVRARLDGRQDLDGLPAGGRESLMPFGETAQDTAGTDRDVTAEPRVIGTTDPGDHLRSGRTGKPRCGWWGMHCEHRQRGKNGKD